MTDKQIINTLKNIQDNCKYSLCNWCRFNDEDGQICTIKMLFLELARYPDSWNMEEIERIIND